MNEITPRAVVNLLGETLTQPVEIVAPYLQA
jgi:hypothetical protein